jgi:hypothetical protein
MPYITKENAKAISQLSAKSRRENPLRAVPPGHVVVPARILEVKEHVPPSDSYPDLVLARTRTQLDLVAGLITKELEGTDVDSKRIRELTDAQTRLSELERVLAGRPLPGSRKPAAEPRRKASQSSPAPIPDTETPQ